jgi:hypothetical protein
MSEEPPAPANRTRTYILVLIVHAAAVIALWTLGHYFGAQ